MKHALDETNVETYRERAKKADKNRRPIESLRLWAKNPRFASDKELKRLRRNIERLGMYKPLLMLEDGTVIGGNQRLKVLRQMDIPDVAVTRITFEEVTGDKPGSVRVKIDDKIQPTIFDSKDQAILEYAVSDNDSHGEWDTLELAPLVKLHLDTDRAKDYRYNTNKTMSTKDLMSKYGTDAEAKEVPPLPKVDPVSKLGEVYELGEHVLLCGDATKRDQYELLLGDRRAECVITDPPYNMAYQGGDGKRRQAIANDDMDSSAFYDFLHDSLTPMMKVTTGAMYVFMGPNEIGTLKRAFEHAGGHWQSTLVWVKNNFTLGGADWQSQYENILYGWPRNVKHHYHAGFRDQGNVWKDPRPGVVEYDPEEEMTTIAVGGGAVRVPGEFEESYVQIATTDGKTDVWHEKRPTRSDEHPTMKPIELLTKAVKASTRLGDLILDPFGGSGSTLMAAEVTGRKCAMMELDPAYCDVIRQRYAKYIGEETGWQELTKPRSS